MRCGNGATLCALGWLAAVATVVPACSFDTRSSSPGQDGSPVTDGPAFPEAAELFVTSPGGLRHSGTYFNGRNLNSPYTATRTETVNIDFDFGNGTPPGGNVGGNDTYSARFEGWLFPPTSGTYNFEVESDDGVRLWVADLTTPLVDEFNDHAATTYGADKILDHASPVPFRIDWYENTGNAVIKFRWRGPRDAAHTPIPLLDEAAPTTLSWSAEATDQETSAADIVYEVCWATDMSCDTDFQAMATVTGATSVELTGLSPEQKYRAVVRAVDGDGKISAVPLTTEFGSRADDAGAPIGGELDHFSVGITNVIVHFTRAVDDATAPNNVQYEICRRQNGDTSCLDDFQVLTTESGTASDVLIGGHNPGQTYHYAVRVRDQAGHVSTPTTELSATTQDP